MAEKHLKKCSTSLVMKERQIIRTLRFQVTPLRKTKIKNSRQMLVRIWRNRNTPPLLVGLQTGTISPEISLEVPQKIGHCTF